MARLSSFCNAAGKDRNRGLQKGPSFSFPSSVSLSLAHFFLFPPFHILPLLSHTHIVNTRHRPCEVGPTFSPDPPPLPLQPPTPPALLLPAPFVTVHHFARTALPRLFCRIPQNDGSCCRKPVQHAV